MAKRLKEHVAHRLMDFVMRLLQILRPARSSQAPLSSHVFILKLKVFLVEARLLHAHAHAHMALRGLCKVPDADRQDLQAAC